MIENMKVIEVFVPGIWTGTVFAPESEDISKKSRHKSIRYIIRATL
jgi:hypothetical protein